MPEAKAKKVKKEKAKDEDIKQFEDNLKKEEESVEKQQIKSPEEEKPQEPKESLIDVIKRRCRINGRRVIEADHSLRMALDKFNAMLICPGCKNSGSLKDTDGKYSCNRCGKETGYNEAFDYNQV